MLVTGVLGEDYSQEGKTVTVCTVFVTPMGVLREDYSQEGKTVTVCTVFVTPMGVLRVLREDYSQDGQNRIVWCCKIVDKMDVVLLLLSCLW